MGDLKTTFKKIEPFIAIGIFMFLIVIGILLFNEQKLKKEISENCGWGKEDYFCYCERSDAMEVKNRAEMVGFSSGNLSIRGLDNATLAG